MMMMIMMMIMIDNDNDGYEKKGEMMIMITTQNNIKNMDYDM